MSSNQSSSKEYQGILFSVFLLQAQVAEIINDHTWEVAHIIKFGMEILFATNANVMCIGFDIRIKFALIKEKRFP